MRFVTEVLPNVVENQVDPCANGCKIPAHWKLADVHNADLNILNKHYENIRPLFDDDSVKYIFIKSQTITLKYTIVQYTPNIMPQSKIMNQESNLFSLLN